MLEVNKHCDRLGDSAWMDAFCANWQPLCAIPWIGGDADQVPIVDGS